MTTMRAFAALVFSLAALGSRARGADRVAADYERVVAPILAAKCAQCHTGGEGRPLLTRVPLLGRFVRPYFEEQIRNGRVQFEFSRGFPAARTGSAMEFLMRLRDVAASGSMPPKAYKYMHPSSRLTPADRAVIAAWAESGLRVYEPLLAAGAPADLRALAPAAFAARLAAELARACPRSASGDAAARAACADKLGGSKLLTRAFRDPFLWGQQKTEQDAELLHARATRFTPYVFLRLYLSLYAFPGGHTVSSSGGNLVVHVPVELRAGLDAGDFPYPFWHSEAKWKAYHEQAELLFIVKDGQVLGALRSARRNAAAAPAPAAAWDGKWDWTDPHGDRQPRMALYERLLSRGNPYRKPLDAAYGSLSAGLRKQDCMACHSPNNKARMKMLEFFNYPNQALNARGRLVEALKQDAMPPGDGVKDAVARKALLADAESFKRLGDAALAFEARRAK